MPYDNLCKYLLAEQQRHKLANSARILAGLRFDKALIQQIFREGAMKESVIYQEILQEGRQEGLQQGLQQGLENGTIQTARSDLFDILAIRFEAIPGPVVEALNRLNDPAIFKTLLRHAVLCETTGAFQEQLRAVLQSEG